MTEDTSVQIADVAGEVFCQTIAESYWKRSRPSLFRFGDRTGEVAGGLRMGKFRLKRNGDMMFRARGKAIELAPIAGRDMLVTIRVGGQCAQGRVRLRSSHRKLLYP